MDRIIHGSQIPCFLETPEFSSGASEEKAFIFGYKTLLLTKLISRIEKQLEKLSIPFLSFTIKADLAGILGSDHKLFTLGIFNKRSREFTITYSTIEELEQTQSEISIFEVQYCKKLFLSITSP